VEDSVRERNVRDKETPGLTQFQVAHELPNRPGVIGQNAGDCGVYRGRDFVNFGRRVWVYRHPTGLLILGLPFLFSKRESVTNHLGRLAAWVYAEQDAGAQNGSSG
jgi:hypothetical protein